LFSGVQKPEAAITHQSVYHRISSQRSVVCSSGNAFSFSRINHWKMDFRLRRLPDSWFCWFVSRVLNSSNPGSIGVQPVHTNCQDEPLQQHLSGRKCKVWLSCIWLSLALYLLIGRVTNWSAFKFSPRYAVCSVAFTTSENRIIHYCVVFSLFFVLPFCVGVFSYYKIFLKIRQHNTDVAPSLQSSRISLQEINMSRTLAYVAGGFLLCWIPMWAFGLWKRFSPDTAPRMVQLTVQFLLYLSSTINPFIYAARNRVFREEFRKLLCWWKVSRSTTEADSGANRKGYRGEKTTETATPLPESRFFPPRDRKEREQRNTENEVAETVL